MLFDYWTKRLPDHCPNCKTYWKYTPFVLVHKKQHPMIGIHFGDRIDITCSNSDCRKNYIWHLDGKREEAPPVAIDPESL